MRLPVFILILLSITVVRAATISISSFASDCAAINSNTCTIQFSIPSTALSASSQFSISSPWLSYVGTMQQSPACTLTSSQSKLTINTANSANVRTTSSGKYGIISCVFGFNSDVVLYNEATRSIDGSSTVMFPSVAFSTSTITFDDVSQCNNSSALSCSGKISLPSALGSVILATTATITTATCSSGLTIDPKVVQTDPYDIRIRYYNVNITSSQSSTSTSSLSCLLSISKSPLSPFFRIVLPTNGLSLLTSSSSSLTVINNQALQPTIIWSEMTSLIYVDSTSSGSYFLSSDCNNGQVNFCTVALWLGSHPSSITSPQNNTDSSAVFVSDFSDLRLGSGLSLFQQSLTPMYSCPDEIITFLGLDVTTDVVMCQQWVKYIQQKTARTYPSSLTLIGQFASGKSFPFPSNTPIYNQPISWDQQSDCFMVESPFCSFIISMYHYGPTVSFSYDAMPFNGKVYSSNCTNSASFTSLGKGRGTVSLSKTTQSYQQVITQVQQAAITIAQSSLSSAVITPTHQCLIYFSLSLFSTSPSTTSNPVYNFTAAQQDTSSPDYVALPTPSTWFPSLSGQSTYTSAQLAKSNPTTTLTIARYTFSNQSPITSSSLKLVSFTPQPVVWDALPFETLFDQSCQEKNAQHCSIELVFPPYYASFVLHSLVATSSDNTTFSLTSTTSTSSPCPFSPQIISLPLHAYIYAEHEPVDYSVSNFLGFYSGGLSLTINKLNLSSIVSESVATSYPTIGSLISAPWAVSTSLLELDLTYSRYYLTHAISFELPDDAQTQQFILYEDANEPIRIDITYPKRDTSGYESDNSQLSSLFIRSYNGLTFPTPAYPNATISLLFDPAIAIEWNSDCLDTTSRWCTSYFNLTGIVNFVDFTYASKYVSSFGSPGVSQWYFVNHNDSYVSGRLMFLNPGTTADAVNTVEIQIHKYYNYDTQDEFVFNFTQIGNIDSGTIYSTDISHNQTYSPQLSFAQPLSFAQEATIAWSLCDDPSSPVCYGTVSILSTYYPEQDFYTDSQGSLDNVILRVVVPDVSILTDVYLSDSTSCTPNATHAGIAVSFTTFTARVSSTNPNPPTNYVFQILVVSGTDWSSPYWNQFTPRDCPLTFVKKLDSRTVEFHSKKSQIVQIGQDQHLGTMSNATFTWPDIRFYPIRITGLDDCVQQYRTTTISFCTVQVEASASKLFPFYGVHGAVTYFLYWPYAIYDTSMSCMSNSDQTGEVIFDVAIALTCLSNDLQATYTPDAPGNCTTASALAASEGHGGATFGGEFYIRSTTNTPSTLTQFCYLRFSYTSEYASLGLLTSALYSQAQIGGNFTGMILNQTSVSTVRFSSNNDWDNLSAVDIATTDFTTSNRAYAAWRFPNALYGRNFIINAPIQSYSSAVDVDITMTLHLRWIEYIDFHTDFGLSSTTKLPCYLSNQTSTIDVVSSQIVAYLIPYSAKTTQRIPSGTDDVAPVASRLVTTDLWPSATRCVVTIPFNSLYPSEISQVQHDVYSYAYSEDSTLELFTSFSYQSYPVYINQAKVTTQS